MFTLFINSEQSYFTSEQKGNYQSKLNGMKLTKQKHGSRLHLVIHYINITNNMYFIQFISDYIHLRLTHVML